MSEQEKPEGGWGYEEIPGLIGWRLTLGGKATSLTYGTRIRAIEAMNERNTQEQS